MTLNFPTTTRKPLEFFRDLSASQPYDKHFEVKATGNHWTPSFVIQERSKLFGLHPVRLFLSPVSPASKRSNVENLAAMTMTCADQILNDPKCSISKIAKAFDRIVNNLARNASRDDVAHMRKTLQKAVSALSQKSIEEGVKYYQQGQPGRFAPNMSISRIDFYKSLAQTIWPLRLNQRFHIGHTPSGEYKVHLTTNRWFFEKWFASPAQPKSWRDYFAKPQSPAMEKIANVQNLAKMVEADEEWIRSYRLDTGSMISTLERFKGKITSHTNLAEKAAIEKAMNQAIATLREVGKLVANDRSNRGWSNNCVVSSARFVWTWSAKGASAIWATAKMPYTIMKKEAASPAR